MCQEKHQQRGRDTGRVQGGYREGTGRVQDSGQPVACAVLPFVPFTEACYVSFMIPTHEPIRVLNGNQFSAAARDAGQRVKCGGSGLTSYCGRSKLSTPGSMSSTIRTRTLLLTMMAPGPRPSGFSACSWMRCTTNGAERRRNINKGKQASRFALAGNARRLNRAPAVQGPFGGFAWAAGLGGV